MVSLLSTARNLGVILVDGLSCGLILQICPLQYPQDSVFPHKQCKETPGRSAIACLDYCISLLAGLPASVNKPPQPIQNAVGRLIDNPPKFSHSPSSMTAIGFLLQPASDSRRWCWPSRLSIELHPSSTGRTTRPMPPLLLCSTTSAGRLVLLHSAQWQLFSVLAPQWWSELPTNVRTVESLGIFWKRLKTHLFRLHLDPACMTPSHDN